MNIDDIKNVPKTDHYLKAIFKRQTELLEKYKEIEGIPDYPFDVDNAEHQIWIKDFLWRVTEELAESWEAAEGKDKKHQIEELSDALHFLVELLILVDFSFGEEDLENFTSEISGYSVYGYFEVIYFLGLVGNTLKNKKWKQSQIQTDTNKMMGLLSLAFEGLICLMRKCGCTDKDIYEFYFKKSKVNQFRVETKY